LTNAFITAGLAQGANGIGGGLADGTLNAFTHQLAHAMLGCAGGVATSGSSDGCAPGAVGAVVGELAAKYATETLGWDKEKALNFAKVMSAASGLIVVQDGNDAGAVNLANTMGDNAARYNYLASHKDSELTSLRNKEEREGLTQAEKDRKLALEKEDAESNARLKNACVKGNEKACLAERAKAEDAAKTYQTRTYESFYRKENLPGYKEIDELLKETTPQGLKDAAYAADLQELKIFNVQRGLGITREKAITYLGLAIGASYVLDGVTGVKGGSGDGATNSLKYQRGSIGDKTVTFGRNANSEYHTIRHVRDELNLNPNEVRSAILNDIPSNLSYGANNGLKIEVGGVKLEYNVFKFPDGTYNVGRITGETKK
jgi:hypothetical protein